MTSVASERFWRCYKLLSQEIRVAADKQFALFERDPWHPSLNFERIHGDLWSARVTYQYRALAYRNGELMNWFWIGTHAEYDRLIGR